MRVAFNSYEQVASWVDDRNACDMKDLTIDGGRVGGTIECDAPGILALSMPYDPGWSCWVDGERVPLVKVNGAFVGMEGRDIMWWSCVSSRRCFCRARL